MVLCQATSQIDYPQIITTTLALLGVVWYGVRVVSSITKKTDEKLEKKADKDLFEAHVKRSEQDIIELKTELKNKVSNEQLKSSMQVLAEIKQDIKDINNKIDSKMKEQTDLFIKLFNQNKRSG
jgi:hypothetical protein